MTKVEAQHSGGLRAWLERRLGYWRELSDLAQQLQRGRNHDPDAVNKLVVGYRALGRDVSLARKTLPGSRLHRFIEALFFELHALLHKRAANPWQDLKQLYRDDIPATLSRIRVPLVSIVLLFLFSAASGAWLVWTFPELAALFLSENTIDEVQAGRLWTDDLLNVVPSSVLTLAIFTNNAVVSFFAFALGVFYGLGTLYIIALNGFMLGSVFAYTARYGLADELFRFVVAHGIVELSVICVAGAAGVLLGEALARPGNQSRTRAFQAASRLGLQLMAALVPILLVCGFIEGYVSPNPAYPLASRVFIGVAWGFVAWALITGRVFRRPQTEGLPRPVSTQTIARRFAPRGG